MRKLLSQRKFYWSLLLLTILSLGYNLQTSAQTSWETVRIGGGGYVTSIKPHPAVPNLFFATTDVGNPYRWNHNAQKWEGLLNGVPFTQYNNGACGNIAVDPQDATGNILYATVGKYADYTDGWSPPGKVIKSTNRGTTWTDAGLTIRVSANGADKSGGDRIAVDPQNSTVVYVTSHADGTYKGANSGTSWSKINALNGRFIAFDVSGGMISGLTKNVFIGCIDGVYQSTDGGEAFTLMAGSPSGAKRAAIHANGTMYVTTNTGVFKWNGGSWSTVSPLANNSYHGVDVNPNNSDQVIVSLSSWDSPTYRSNDGGLNWFNFARSIDVSEMPFLRGDHYAKVISDFAWDPFNEGHVWFTDIFAIYQTTNIWAATVPWKARVIGEEEFVTMGTILCPPGNQNKLLSGGADLGGFDHKSITEPPTKSMVAHFPWTPQGQSGNMVGVAVQETNPSFIARVGRRGWNGAAYGGYSTNGGDNYTIFSTYPPGTSGGRIVISATSETMIWVGQGGSAYRSVNRGGLWTAVTGLPAGLVPGTDIFNGGSPNPLAADKVNGNKFYAYHGGNFYKSTDGGSTFSVASALPVLTNISFLKVETVPGAEGHVWVSLQTSGLWYSTNSGASFTKVTNVQNARLMSVGKAASTVPAVYVMGTVNNIADGVFRSDDNGVTWTQMDTPSYRMGNQPNAMAADREVYGRVFIGTNGNGIYVGSSPAPAVPANLAASASGSNQVNLSWTDTSNDEAHFRIERKQGAGNYVFLSNVPANASSFSDSGLLPGTSFSYRIRSEGNTGSSAWSNEASATTSGTIPTQLFITGSTTGSQDASLPKEYSYDANTGTRWGATGVLSNTWIIYDLGSAKTVNYLKLMMFNGHVRTNPIKVEMGNGSSWTQVWSGNTALTAAFQTIDIADNTNRYVKISLTGKTSEGTYWFSIYETEIYGSDPAAPANLMASASGSNQVNLSWTDNSNDEAHFRIERKEEGGTYEFLSNAPANATSFSNTGVPPSATFSYRVRSESNNVSSAWSNETSATTSGTAPAKLIITGSTTGSQDPSFPKEYSYDGKTGTRWGATGELSNTWIIYDLGVDKTVNYLKLMMFNGTIRTNPIKVEMGNGNTWTQVWSGNTALSADFQTINIADNKNRYVKITMTGKTSEGTYWFSIYETEIYGSDPAVATIKLDEANYSYDGNPHAVSGFTYGAGGIEDKLSPVLKITYKDTIGNVLNSVPVNAGTYVVEAFYAGNTYYKSVSDTATVTIAPKALTITASNRAKECGTALNLGITAFTVEGLLAADSVNSVLLTSDGAAESGSKGTFVITAANAQGSGLSNYLISYVNGSLAVSDVTKPIPDLAELPQVNVECSVTMTAPTATDACAGTLTASTNDPLTYNQQGTYTITWIFDDGNGNTTTQNQSVVVKDVSAPVITHQPVPVQCYSADGNYIIPALVATDNCGTSNTSYSISGATTRSGSSANASGSFNIGTSTIHWLVDDGHGNQVTGETSVVINNPVAVSVPDVYAMNSNMDAKNTLYLGYGPSSLTINALPSGGTGPYTYLWNNVEGASSLSVNSAGVYTVNVIDALGCSTTASISINVEDVRCGNNNDKVKICHNGKEICISSNAVDDHLNHGDRLGACNTSVISNSKVVEIANLREVETAKSNWVSVYPNPVELDLQVSVSKLQPGATLKLYNGTGTLMRSLQLSNSTESISMQGFLPGLYLLVIKNGNEVTTKKVLKK